MKPLSKKTRYSSLSILFFLFLIAGPILIAYSEGYRLSDIGHVLKVVKTGGIFIHSENVANTQVYLDGEFVKNSGIFLRNTFAQDLKPNAEYKIEVYKDGYNGYVKKLNVYPSLVTEVTVLMLPTQVDEREILKYFDKSGIATSTSPFQVGTKIPLFQTNTEYQDLMVSFGLASSTKELTEFEKAQKNLQNLKSRTTNATTTATSTKEIPEYFVKLGIEEPDKLKNLVVSGDEVAWLENGNIVLNWVGKDDNTPYYYCEGKEECRKKITLDWQDDIIRFDYFPGRFNAWVVLVPSGIWAVEIDDRSERNIQPVYTGKNLDFRINNNDMLVVKEGNKFIELSL